MEKPLKEAAHPMARHPWRVVLWPVVIVLAVAAVVVTGGSFYMLDYSLAPIPARADTASRYARLYKRYPETRPWVDSLRSIQGLRDTFLTMPSGERHHALCVNRAAGRQPWCCTAGATVLWTFSSWPGCTSGTSAITWSSPTSTPMA